MKTRIASPLIAGALLSCGSGPSFPEIEIASGACTEQWVQQARPLAKLPDTNGDGVAELLVTPDDSGSPRLELRSGKDGARLRSYPVSMKVFRALVADLDGDGAAELLVSTVDGPDQKECEGGNCGGSFAEDPHLYALEAISTADGKVLWTRPTDATAPELNSRVTVIDDEDGDGVRDLVVAAPFTRGLDPAPLRYVSGATGAELRVQTLPDNAAESYGNELVTVPDLDGDGRSDLIVSDVRGPYDRYAKGRVTAISTGTGAVLWERTGDQVAGALLYGHGLATLDRGEGAFPDILVGVHNSDTPDDEPMPGQMEVLDGRTGERRMILAGRRGFEHFGQAVADVGDVNGDGVSDFGVGAPMPGAPVLVTGYSGRFSIHSGVDGAVLVDLEELIPADKLSNYYGSSVFGLDDRDVEGKSTFVTETTVKEGDLLRARTLAYRCAPWTRPAGPR
jgi:hypothetical protein